MATVRFEHASRVYVAGQRPAVDRLSLEIADGELCVLVGPSGSGKSTALRMLAGLETVDGGKIFIGDRDVTDLAPKQRDIAMVFQSYALYPHMTVAQNLGFALRVKRVSRAEVKQRVQEAARLLELEPYLDRRPRALSGGQRQRVAMGRAIVREPQVFCMDEPLSNLDAKLRVSTRTQIASLQRRLGVTTVYVTHDQVEAMTMGDRVAVLHDGVLQQVDRPLDIYDRPRNVFVAGFMGSPAMNLVPGRRTPDGVEVLRNDGAGDARARCRDRRWGGHRRCPSRRADDHRRRGAQLDHRLRGVRGGAGLRRVRVRQAGGRGANRGAKPRPRASTGGGQVRAPDRPRPPPRLRRHHRRPPLKRVNKWCQAPFIHSTRPDS